jgi:hypothetical protein
MKFRATIETSGRGYDVEFDLDDEAAAKARLAQALAEIQKRFAAANEKAMKPAAPRVTPANAEASARKDGDHAK